MRMAKITTKRLRQLPKFNLLALCELYKEKQQQTQRMVYYRRTTHHFSCPGWNWSEHFYSLLIFPFQEKFLFCYLLWSMHSIHTLRMFDCKICNSCFASLSEDERKRANKKYGSVEYIHNMYCHTSPPYIDTFNFFGGKVLTNFNIFHD